MTTFRLFSASLTASQIRQWIRTDCQSVSALLLPLLLLLHLLLPVKVRENGMGILARGQLQHSHKLSNERQTVTRVPVSTPQAATDREGIEETFQSVTPATNITVASVIRFVVKDASRWVMRPKTVGVHGLQIRTNNSHRQLHRTSSSNHSVETGDVSSVGQKDTTNAIVLS